MKMKIRLVPLFMILAASSSAAPVASYEPSNIVVDEEGKIIEWKDSTGANNAIALEENEPRAKRVDLPSGAMMVADFTSLGSALRIPGSESFEGRDRSWIIVFRPERLEMESARVLISAAYASGLERANYAWGSFINKNGCYAFARSKNGDLVGASVPVDSVEWYILVAAVQAGNNVRIRLFPLETMELKNNQEGMVRYHARGTVDAVPKDSEFVVIGASTRFSNYFRGQIAEVRIFNENLNSADKWIREVERIRAKYLPHSN